MPSVTLTPEIVQNYKCPSDKKKICLFDNKVTGLNLEVRISGNKTFYLNYTDDRGAKRSLKLGKQQDLTLKQARQLAQQKRTQIAMGQDPKVEREIKKAVPTFAEFVTNQYLPHIKNQNRSWESYRSVINNHLIPAFGSLYMDLINRENIEKHYQGLIAKGLAVGTANKILTLIKAMFNLAIKQWQVPGITTNPADYVKKLPDNNHLERYLTTEEMYRLKETLVESQNQQLQHIVALLLLTGARKQEVLKAKWSEFNFKTNTWRIPMTKNGKPRSVPLNEEALNVLQILKERHLSDTYVVPNPSTGKPFISIFASWDTARRKAGLADVRIHDLRHTFASLLVNNGRSLYEVQQLLGHSESSTTQRYAHLSEGTLRNASQQGTQELKGLFSQAQPVQLSL